MAMLRPTEALLITARKAPSVVWVAVPTETLTGSIGTNEEAGEEWGAKIVSVGIGGGLFCFYVNVLFILRRRNTLGVGFLIMLSS
jgi:hypothetical protein